MKRRNKPDRTPRQSNGAQTSVPRAELLRVFGLFNAGQFGEMEMAAQALVLRYPTDGQSWKALGVAQLVLRKDAALALQRALSLMPDDAEVSSNLGGVFAARGELEAAAACYRRALESQPQSAQAHCNLGDVLARQGDWLEAETSCRQAVALQPGLAAAHLNLGNALMGQQRLDEAIACYLRAQTVSPGLAEAHHAMGLALKQQGQLSQALASFEKAANLRPRHAGTHDQLGVVLHRVGQLEAALDSLRVALQLQPDMASAQFHLANVLADLGRADQAAAAYRLALSIQPGQAEFHLNLGVVLLAAGRPGEAVVDLQHAVRLQPELATAHNSLGNALAAMGQLSASLPHFERALHLAPDLVAAHSSLAHVLKTMGRPADALVYLRRARELEPARLELHSEAMFVQNYGTSAREPASDQRADAQRFGEMATRRGPIFTSWPNRPDRDKCLKVGLVSGDLHAHPVGYFLESVLGALASRFAGRVEVWAYANHTVEDAVSRRMQVSCQAWRPVARMGDAALAAQVRSDGIDVLIDLSGHTARNRLPMLACKPAPVQVSWLGYCGTTGVPAMDAFIGDPWITPPGSQAAFTERIVRLPETFLCFTPPEIELPVDPLPALAGKGVRLACFNQLAKMSDSVVSVWARVLQALPGSQLALQSAALCDQGVQDDVRARFTRYGVDADRLLLQPAQDRPDYLAAYRHVDIALDPFPYPGGTTTLDALWMGVPVLTLPESAALSRQGLSIMQNMGLADWIAKDPDDYVALALRHASDLPALSALRQRLRPQLLQSSLCDAPRFAGHLEHCLRDLWRDWCDRK